MQQLEESGLENSGREGNRSKIHVVSRFGNSNFDELKMF